MGWRDAAAPVRMQRVALVCPKAALRDMLVHVADAGVVEIDRTTPEAQCAGAGQPPQPPRRAPRWITGTPFVRHRT